MTIRFNLEASFDDRKPLSVKFEGKLPLRLVTGLIMLFIR